MLRHQQAKENGDREFKSLAQDPLSGITKQEYFAAMAMQGLIQSIGSKKEDDGSYTFSVGSISQLAVVYANSLLLELEKTK